jgi:hypothetical protein
MVGWKSQRVTWPSEIGGKRIMSLSDELKELETLFRNGTLTENEFQLAKQRVLSESRVSQSARHLEDIKAQNEIAQLDREWELERDNYMIEGRYGSRHIPTKGSSIGGGVVMILFGLGWTIFAFVMTANAPSKVVIIFPIFGVLFILFGAVASIREYLKADQYQAGYERSQSRRNQLLADHRRA